MNKHLDESEYAKELAERAAELDRRESALKAAEAALSEKQVEADEVAKKRNPNLYSRVKVPIKLLDKVIIAIMGIMCVVVLVAIATAKPENGAATAVAGISFCANINR